MIVATKMKLPHATETTMSRRCSMIALLGTAILAAACGSGHDATGMGGAGGTGGAAGTGDMAGAGGAGSPVVYPSCASGAPWTVIDGVCAPSGFPFVQYAFPHSNLCGAAFACPTTPSGTTIRMSQPAAGTLCVSGTDPSAGDSTGIILGFPAFAAEGLTATYQKVFTRFNADLLGITQFRFTIDRPPPAGVSVWANSLTSDVCIPPSGCFSVASTLPNPLVATGTATSVTSTVPFADLVANPPAALESRSLASISFDVGQGDFDFCVRDFQFLDASGAVVAPMP